MSGYIGKNNVQVTEANANATPVFTLGATHSVTGSLGNAFSYTPAVTDPDKITHVFYMTGSNIPSEYSMNSATGEITASTVTTSGTHTIVINVSDGPNTVQQTLTITVSDIQVTYSGLTGNVYVGDAISNTPSITNPDNLTLTFGISGVTGATINSSTGVISGNYQSVGANTFAITVTDQYNNVQNISHSVTVDNYTVTISNPLTGNVPNNQAVSISPSVSNPNSATFTFSMTTEAGLSVNSSTGVISGTPTTLGNNRSLTWTLTDNFGNVKSVTMTYNIIIGQVTNAATLNAQEVINGGYGVLYYTTGTTTFPSPAGVSYVRATVVGGGGNGVSTYSGSAYGGGGGGLSFINNAPVVAGTSYNVVVGNSSSASTFAFDGSSIQGSGASGSGGAGASGGTTMGSGGTATNPGGYNQSGGGGAGGYGGTGGNGNQGAGGAGSNGAGGGGAGGHWSQGGGGGGTGWVSTGVGGTNGAGGQHSSTHSSRQGDGSQGLVGTSTTGASDGQYSNQGGHGGDGGGGGGGACTAYGYSGGSGGRGYVAVWWNSDGGAF